MWMKAVHKGEELGGSLGAEHNAGLLRATMPCVRSDSYNLSQIRREMV